MTTAELKIEIQKELDQVPENVLPDVLIYLKMINQSTEKVKLNKFFEQTLIEDNELLKRLAQ